MKVNLEYRVSEKSKEPGISSFYGRNHGRQGEIVTPSREVKYGPHVPFSNSYGDCQPFGEWK